MQELVGQQLGKYDLAMWLGEGAHVHAFLARETGKPDAPNVVIKVLKSDLKETPEFLERFEREAEAALRLDHPNLVKILEYAKQADRLYLVEEFLHGGSLRDIFAKEPGKPLSMEQTTHTLDQIASVLDYAHAQGIIHHDMKPENILYDSEGNAHLSDLGITKNIDPNAALTREELEFGNPFYMSPEEWERKPADWRTDIYALGIIVYQMLAGELPFNKTFATSVMYMHLMHMMTKPTPLTKLRPDLSPSLEKAINKAIEKDRTKRYNKVQEFAEAFHAALTSPVTK
jgi:serine/threonine-protein kinase